MYRLKVRESFEAAHRIAGYPGKCDRLHGHNWEAEVVFEGRELDHLGMVFDFKEAKNLLRQVLESLDHRYLNEIPPFDALNPTAENLARFIYEKIKSDKEFPQNLCLTEVTIYESSNSAVSYMVDG